MKDFPRVLKAGFFFGVGLLGVLIFSGPVFAGSLLEGWTGDVFAGYNQSGGNTDKGAGSIAAQAVKKWETSSFTLKGSAFYSQSNNKMDGQKWDALAKYSYDFGKDDLWFNFYQVLVDHDYFADIDYRVTPATGLGYHVSRTEDWTWDVDAGLGYRITRYRIDTASDDEDPTLLLHTFMKKKILENAFLSEDLTVYPGLSSDAGVQTRSETIFSNPLSKDLDLEVKYIIDHNTEPSAGKKKTDTQFIVGLKYKF